MLRNRAQSNQLSPQCYRRRASGFTLVELLIVVVILGILAAVVIPMFFDSSKDAKESALKETLQIVRKQLELYKLQHNGKYPLLTLFEAQLTGKSNPDGSATGSPRLGPYIQRIPKNPITNDSTIGNGGIGTSSWFYDEDVGLFKANCHAVHFQY